MNYVMHVLVYLEIYAVAALGLNIVAGYCGVMSLCHASFVAIGAYAYALATLAAGLSFAPALGVAIAVGAAASVAVSLPALRLRGDFLVLGTLAVQSLTYNLLYNWSDVKAPIGSWANLTNGPFGISGIPRPALGGVAFDSLPAFLLLCTAVTCAAVAIARRLHAAPWRRALEALRDDEVAARSLGKSAARFKFEAMAAACALAATAGALYASYATYLDPSSASLDEGILMLAMVLVGGVGNVRGPLVGAFAVILLPEVLRALSLPDGLAANVRLACFGLLLTWLVHARPRGLAGKVRVG